jgi:hypothetical protein
MYGNEDVGVIAVSFGCDTALEDVKKNWTNRLSEKTLSCLNEVIDSIR